jgi:putative transposase
VILCFDISIGFINFNVKPTLMNSNTQPTRKSIRLKNYDYTREAAFFITLVCQDRVKRFGKIVNGEMILNTFGEIAVREWIKTVQLRSNVSLGEFVIMPDHAHMILHIDERSELLKDQTEQPEGKLYCPAHSLGAIIRGYKGAVTRQIREILDPSREYLSKEKIWQRDYYDKIIRNQREYETYKRYIRENPRKGG